MPTVIPTSLADQIIAAKISEWEQKRKEAKETKKQKEMETRLIEFCKEMEQV